MSEQQTFRAGDVVKHGPSGETWVLACDEFSGSVWPCGWPETRANASDCELVTPADDGERLDMLTTVAAIQSDQRRRAIALSQLPTPEGSTR